MESVISKKRLDKGLWASAAENSCGRFWMIVGAIMMMWGCSQFTWHEGVYYYHQLELHEAIETLVEISCDGDPTTVLQGQLVHMSDCSVSGLQTLDPGHPPAGMESMATFQANLPSSMECAWFGISLFEYVCQDGDTCLPDWQAYPALSNLVAWAHAAPTLLIGNFPAGEGIAVKLPDSPPRLTASAAYQKPESGWTGVTTPPNLGPSNMQICSEVGNMTTNGADEPSVGDAKVQFACGVASRVSVLAMVGTDAQLTSWVSSQGGGYEIGMVDPEPATAHDMLASQREVYDSLNTVGHFRYFLWNAFGMWCFAFSNHVNQCMRYGDEDDHQRKERLDVMCGSLVRALLLSVIPSLTAYGCGWVGFRFPVLFWLACAVVMPAVGCFAFRAQNAEGDEDKEEEQEEKAYLNLDEAASGLAIGSRPSGSKVGSKLGLLRMALVGALIGLCIALVTSLILAMTWGH